MIPFWLSERYTNNAFRTWQSDPGGAFADLDRARRLNPFAEEPCTLAEGAIARESGDAEREIEAFRGATKERPEEWATHYFLAQAYLDRNPELARRELDLARGAEPAEQEARRAGGPGRASRSSGL